MGLVTFVLLKTINQHTTYIIWRAVISEKCMLLVKFRLAELPRESAIVKVFEFQGSAGHSSISKELWCTEESCFHKLLQNEHEYIYTELDRSF